LRDLPKFRFVKLVGMKSSLTKFGGEVKDLDNVVAEVLIVVFDVVVVGLEVVVVVAGLEVEVVVVVVVDAVVEAVVVVEVVSVVSEVSF
jgi:hypothetical protein